MPQRRRVAALLLDAKKLTLLYRLNSQRALFRIEWKRFSSSWARGLGRSLGRSRDAVIPTARPLAVGHPKSKTASEESAFDSQRPSNAFFHYSKPQAMPSSTTLVGPLESGKWPSTTLPGREFLTRALAFQRLKCELPTASQAPQNEHLQKDTRGVGAYCYGRKFHLAARRVARNIRFHPAAHGSILLEYARSRTQSWEVHS